MAANTAKAYKDTYQIIQMMCSLSDSVPVKWRRWLWEKALDTATDLIALIVYAYDEKNLQTKLAYIDKCLTKFSCGLHTNCIFEILINSLLAIDNAPLSVVDCTQIVSLKS